MNAAINAATANIAINRFITLFLRLNHVFNFDSNVLPNSVKILKFLIHFTGKGADKYLLELH